MDDRNTWIKGPDACETLMNIIDLSQKAGSILGFHKNKAKTQIATTSQELSQLVDTATPEEYPPATTTIKIRGLTYDLTTPSITLSDEAMTKYTTRAKRIPWVTNERGT